MIGLYFGGREFRTNFGNDFGNIELDAVIDESHDWSAEATTNPVEDGAPVSDHIIEQPDQLKLKCFVTDTPITTSQNLTSGDFNQSPAGTRTQPVFDLLYQLVKKRLPLTVYTKHAIYDNMALTSVSIPRAADSGEALEFSLDFVNIRMVKTETVDVPAGISPKKEAKQGGRTGPVAKKTEPKKAAGKKQAEVKPKPPAASKPQSTLSSWFN